jgi:glycosyltransferase involved in cell wall biosynthesis
VKIAIITTDSREHFKDYGNPVPYFGTAPEALLQGFGQMPEIEVHVLSCARARMKSPDKLAPNTYFHSLLVPKIGWMSTGYQGCVRAVRRKLREIQPDIVHGQGTERDCAMDAVFSGFPNVLTIHGNMAELSRLFRARIGNYFWLAGRLENFALPRTAGVFCNSAYTEDLVRPRARRTWRVPNALRNAFFEAPSGVSTRLSPPILLNVGVITERKRQVELLDVIQTLDQRGLKFQFQFIGDINADAPYAATFLKKIKPLEAKGCARYLGPLPTGELIRHYDTASAVVHFPTEEAFGLVVAEALARNLKLFGARLGGIQDIVADVPGSELIDSQDWGGLTEALATWLREGGRNVNCSADVMRRRYHPSVVAQRHLEIYREVLSAWS